MKKTIKLPCCRFTIEKIQKLDENKEYQDFVYLLYVKSLHVETLFEFDCDEEGKIKMFEKMLEELEK